MRPREPDTRFLLAITAAFLINLSTAHRYISIVHDPTGITLIAVSLVAAVTVTLGLGLSLWLIIPIPRAPGFHVQAVLLFGGILATILLELMRTEEFAGYLQTIGTLCVAALIAAVVDRIRYAGKAEAQMDRSTDQ